MRTTIRSNTFETNSSSVHALVLVPTNVLSAWQEHPEQWLDVGELLDHTWGTEGTRIAGEDCLVDDEVMWERRNGYMENCGGYWLDEDELLTLNLVAFKALSEPNLYASQAAGTYLDVEEQPNGDILLNIEYSA